MENPFAKQKALGKTEHSADTKLVQELLPLEDAIQFVRLSGSEGLKGGDKGLTDEEINLINSNITPEDLRDRIGKRHSKAELHEGMHGGIIPVDIDPALVKDWDTAVKSFSEKYGGEKVFVWKEWSNLPFVPPENCSFNVCILSYEKLSSVTKPLFDTIEEDIDRLDLRPLTLTEMIMVGVTEPQLTVSENDFYFSAQRHNLDLNGRKIEMAFYPFLWGFGAHRLDREMADKLKNKPAGDHYYFLCTPKK